MPPIGQANAISDTIAVFTGKPVEGWIDPGAENEGRAPLFATDKSLQTFRLTAVIFNRAHRFFHAYGVLLDF